MFAMFVVTYVPWIHVYTLLTEVLHFAHFNAFRHFVCVGVLRFMLLTLFWLTCNILFCIFGLDACWDLPPVMAQCLWHSAVKWKVAEWNPGRLGCTRMVLVRENHPRIVSWQCMFKNFRWSKLILSPYHGTPRSPPANLECQKDTGVDSRQLMYLVKIDSWLFLAMLTFVRKQKASLSPRKLVFPRVY